ncbi:unnamed protein product [Euphydryas editha]|uniref:Retrovirus-related Pol polyprotein from transposon TNT 1-94 n=1 Tax=Euphydryas editha TaxID=104508 RepID=A0AAU9VAW8_EUPED|nr:unnamed protein product [Euphydryas editha]
MALIKNNGDKKADIGILLGYTDTGYRVLINNKVIIARHCDIIEEDVILCRLDDEEENKNAEEIKDNEKKVSASTRNKNEEKSNIEKNLERDGTYKINSDDKKEIIDKRPRRKVKPPVRFDEEFGYYCIYVNVCDAMIPDNFQEAITCNESNKWKEAMNREMKSWEK